jgi:hypothetical protein
VTTRLDWYIGRQLSRLYETEQGLGDEFRRVGERHADEVEVAHICEQLAQQCVAHVDLLGPHVDRYARQRPSAESDRPGVADSVHGFLRRKVAAAGPRQREPGLTLLDDLGSLYLAITAADLLWIQVGQAAQALQDYDLLATVSQRSEQTMRQLRLLKTRIKQLAPQTLTVA